MNKGPNRGEAMGKWSKLSERCRNPWGMGQKTLGTVAGTSITSGQTSKSLPKAQGVGNGVGSVGNSSKGVRRCCKVSGSRVDGHVRFPEVVEGTIKDRGRFQRQ
jgi:hypothetical protein